MSAPKRPDGNCDGPLWYAPKWAREERHQPAKVQEVPWLVKSPPLDVATEEEDEVEESRQLVRHGYDIQSPFVGDLAIKEMQRRLALAPETLPAPPQYGARDTLWPLVGRFAVVCVFAASIAGMLVFVPAWLKRAPGPERGTATLVSNVRVVPVAAAAMSATAQAEAPAPAPATTSIARTTFAMVEKADIDVVPGTGAEDRQPVAVDPVPPPPATNVAAVQPQQYPAPSARPEPPAAVEGQAKALDRDEIGNLLKRGEQYVANGDIASARLVLKRAADAGDARAALALGATFDPAVLKELGAIGIAADVELARRWYQMAVAQGSPEASKRLQQLAQQDR